MFSTIATYVANTIFAWFVFSRFVFLLAILIYIPIGLYLDFNKEIFITCLRATVTTIMATHFVLAILSLTTFFRLMVVIKNFVPNFFQLIQIACIHLGIYLVCLIGFELVWKLYTSIPIGMLVVVLYYALLSVISSILQVLIEPLDHRSFLNLFAKSLLDLIKLQNEALLKCNSDPNTTYKLNVSIIHSFNKIAKKGLKVPDELWEKKFPNQSKEIKTLLGKVMEIHKQFMSHNRSITGTKLEFKSTPQQLSAITNELLGLINQSNN